LPSSSLSRSSSNASSSLKPPFTSEPMVLRSLPQHSTHSSWYCGINTLKLQWAPLGLNTSYSSLNVPKRLSLPHSRYSIRVCGVNDWMNRSTRRQWRWHKPFLFSSSLRSPEVCCRNE
jgi:hypothetical protein